MLHFYINQDSIAEAHCENKDKPEMNCHGSCYLQKELQSQNQIENSNEENESNQTTITFRWPDSFFFENQIKIPFHSYEELTILVPYLNEYKKVDSHSFFVPPEHMLS